MIIVAGTLRFPADKMEALLPHARAVIAATRKENGCLVYSFAEDMVEPGLVRIFEIWESRALLDAHGKQAHMQPWRDAVEAAGGHSRDLKVYPSGEGEVL